MKTFYPISAYLIIPLIFGLFSCVEELPDVTGKNHIYQLQSVSEHQIDGHVKLRERNDGSAQIELVLNNLDSKNIYPAYMHFNNALEGGGVALTLTAVDGQSQNSVTEVSTLDSGQPVSYQDLLEFDGHLNIQMETELGAVVAQVDIGKNALTGRFQQFQLTEGDLPGVEGVLTIEERESGFSLITVQMEGSIEGENHPVTLNFGSIHDQHSLAGTLNPVDGTSGISRTHLEQLNGELIVSYQSLVDFQGFLRVHLGEGTDMSTIMAQGNIAYVEN